MSSQEVNNGILGSYPVATITLGDGSRLQKVAITDGSGNVLGGTSITPLYVNTVNGGGGSSVLPFYLIGAVDYDTQTAAPTSQVLTVPADAVYIPAFASVRVSSGAYVDGNVDISFNGILGAGVFSPPPIVFNIPIYSGDGTLIWPAGNLTVDFSPNTPNAVPCVVSVSVYGQSFPL